MNSSHLNNLLFVLLLTLGLPLSACAASVSGGPLDGQVLEEGTNQPLPGAIVVVRWQGNVGGPVESSTTCYHVETATTDNQGRFHIHAWKTTEAALGLHPSWFDRLFFGPTIRDREILKSAYHPGYTFGTVPSEKDTVWLKPFTGGRGERFKYLDRVISNTSCGDKDTYKNLYRITYAVYEEAKAIAQTEDEKRHAERFKDLADDALVNRSKPTTYNKRGREINVDPKDAFRPEDIK
jgi:hypothetical protein